VHCEGSYISALRSGERATVEKVNITKPRYLYLYYVFVPSRRLCQRGRLHKEMDIGGGGGVRTRGAKMRKVGCLLYCTEEPDALMPRLRTL
jgi:hypothetical protein